ncbi:protein involved in meta-pathway of phenol degradation [Thioflavicoccus mobilis 8321]|uniref:Protein involved in meta-pathway of phenol degradation n=1 Tax=Thioflavicoccus mobilis 8321 TaxID=765912 RepID=L0H153_9GAMM|nr:protein involved in meta-pathway of phenol degradation [Thioflavicoccus mobilis 8321]
MVNDRRFIPWLALSTLAVSSTTNGFEGPQQYPLGAENFMAGALPPAGDYVIDYLGYYTGEYRDHRGDKVPGIDIDAVFNAMRYVHVSDHRILGGDWGFHVIVPFVHQDLHIPNPSLAGDAIFGLGDITIDPLIIGWHFPPDWHVTLGLDINLPTGRYDKNDPTNSIGSNYWSVEPIAAFTYLNDAGLEVSVKAMYNFKTENDETDYRSGDDIHLDYLISQHRGPWAFGIGGYYLAQTESDRQNGQRVGPDGTRAQVIAFGPALRYDYKGMSFIGTWNHETAVENYFQGDKFYFKFIAAF